MIEKVRLGRTGLMVTRVAFGCIPIQRLSHDNAVALLRYAYDHGVNFFDTARAYTNSEERIGAAFPGSQRQKVIIASKSMSVTYKDTMANIDESLRQLGTDYIDLFQWHNPEKVTELADPDSPYQAMCDAKKAGKIRFLGITNHHLERARTAIAADAFDTIQFPLSVLSAPEELRFAEDCAKRDIGVIAMKAMCGGMLQDGRLPFVFLNQFPHIVPIWGIEKTSELDQFLHLAAHPEPFNEAMRQEADALRQQFGDNFCRGCGYCLPCPEGINLPILMRISTMVSRMAVGSQFTPQRLKEVKQIDDCTGCRSCVGKCPYHLEAPEILKEQQAAFYRLYEEYEKAGGV